MVRRIRQPRKLKYLGTDAAPTSWQGYSLLVQQWEGQTYLPAAEEEESSGRMLSPSPSNGTPHFGARSSAQGGVVAETARLLAEGLPALSTANTA